jgi:CubicO group peptidase (beta-lactamase class C family)
MGEISTYSNYGITVIGHMVELVSGQFFGNYLYQYIFGPLGMRDSHYMFNGAVANSPKFVPPSYRASTNPTDNTLLIYSSWFGYYINAAPAGSMWSSARDVSKFVVSHLNNGSGLFSSNATATNAYARHFDHLMFNDGRDLSDVATASSNMGIVWFRSQRKGVSFIEHRGDIDPYHTAVSVMPSHDIGLVFLGVGGDNAYYTSVVESLIDEVLQSHVLT